MSKPRHRVAARRFVDVEPPASLGRLVPLAPLPEPSAPSSTQLVVHFRDGGMHRIGAVTEVAWTKGALVIDADQGRVMYPIASISYVYEPQPRASLSQVMGKAA